jgi:hypothetical protein
MFFRGNQKSIERGAGARAGARAPHAAARRERRRCDHPGASTHTGCDDGGVGSGSGGERGTAPKSDATPGAPGLRAVAVAYDDLTMITIAHWRRLLDGELYAASSRIEWALLLRTTQPCPPSRTRAW